MPNFQNEVLIKKIVDGIQVAVYKLLNADLIDRLVQESMSYEISDKEKPKTIDDILVVSPEACLY